MPCSLWLFCKDMVGLVGESLKCLLTKPPSEILKLVCDCISNRVKSHKTGTLGKVFRRLHSMKCRPATLHGKLSVVDVVYGPSSIRATQRALTTSGKKGSDSRTVAS